MGGRCDGVRRWLGREAREKQRENRRKKKEEKKGEGSGGFLGRNQGKEEENGGGLGEKNRSSEREVCLRKKECRYGFLLNGSLCFHIVSVMISGITSVYIYIYSDV